MQAAARLACLPASGPWVTDLTATLSDSQEVIETVVQEPLPSTSGPLPAELTAPLTPVTADDWESLFLRWKAGEVASGTIRSRLGDAVYDELVRRWRIYMDGALAYQEEQRLRDLRGKSTDGGSA